MAKGSGSAGRGGGASASRATATGPAALTEDNIAQIAIELGAGGGRGDTVAIADVRAAFYERFDPAGATTAAQFDRALLNMQLDGNRIGLSRLDDPQALTARDRRFAVRVGDDFRHVLYLKN